MGCFVGAWPGVEWVRRRKLGVTFPLAWKRGKPTCAPTRFPRRDVAKFSSARAASTLAHSKTSPGNSCLHDRPRVPSWLNGESSDSPFFQALNSLMKENPDHESERTRTSDGTSPHEVASRLVDLASRFALTRAKWWFTVKRRAPAHLASRIRCCAFGSRANWNVTARESTRPVREMISAVRCWSIGLSIDARCDRHSLPESLNEATVLK